MKYSSGNPYALSVLLMEGWKDFCFAVGTLDLFAKATSDYLLVKKKADLWQELAILSRPMNWEGGR